MTRSPAASGQRAEDEATNADAQAIQERVQTIFEASDFPDLTGQRIAKVVKTIVLVEERIGEMLRLWSEPAEAAASGPVADRRCAERIEEAALLNGPALPYVAAVSQDAIDVMFP